MQGRIHPLLPVSLLGLLGGLASAQDPVPLVLEGDVVSGVGAVTRIDNLAVNDKGEWMVEADTDHPDTSADSVVIRNGALFVREGDPLPAPAGASIGSFDSVTLNLDGLTGWNLFLDGTSGSSDDSGVFLGTTLLIQESDVSTAPQFSPGTPYIGFFEVKIDDAGNLLLMASVDDPAIASSVDRAIVFVDVDTVNGVVLSETVIVKEGDLLPGQTELVDDFGTGPHDFAFNSAGQVMYRANLAGDTSVDQAIYVDSTLLAQEGSPSPVAGRNWSSLASARVDLNDHGDHVYRGLLDGDASTNTLIVKNGAKFVQEGDSLPAIGGFAFTSFGTGPVHISNGGDVLWYGDWDDPDTSVDTGLFLNEDLLVQEGVTTIGGVAVDILRGTQDGYALSPDGRFVIFEAVLADGTEGAFLIELGGFTPMVPCFGNAGVLTGSGSASLGDTFALEMTNGQAAGVFPIIGISSSAIAGWPPCGIPVPGFGEFMISITAPNPLHIQQGPQWFGAPVPFNFTISAPSLVGVDFFSQGLFADLLGVSPAEPFRLTNGLIITIGP